MSPDNYYVQHIFPAGAKNFLGESSSPLLPISYGPAGKCKILHHATGQ